MLCQADQKAIFCMDCVRMNKDCIFQLNFKAALVTSLNTALHIHTHANAWDDFKILSGQVCDASDRCSNNSLYQTFTLARVDRLMHLDTGVYHNRANNVLNKCAFFKTVF